MLPFFHDLQVFPRRFPFHLVAPQARLLLIDLTKVDADHSVPEFGLVAAAVVHRAKVMIQLIFRLESHIALLLALLEGAEEVLLGEMGFQARIVVEVGCEIIADGATEVLFVHVLQEIVFIEEPFLADVAPRVHALDMHLQDLAVKEVVATEVAPWMLQLWRGAVQCSSPPTLLAMLLNYLGSNLLSVEIALLADLFRVAVKEDPVESLLICLFHARHLLHTQPRRIFLRLLDDA